MNDSKQKKVRESAAKTETASGTAPAADSVQSSDSVQEKERENRTIGTVGYRLKPAARKRLFSRKWMYPATYLAAAAIILALMWWIQDLRGPETGNRTEEAAEIVRSEETVQEGEEALPAGAPAERMQWPADPAEAEVVMPFYDPAAPGDEKQAAILQQGNRYTPNTGIVMAREDNAAFDVRAAMSGEVTRSEKVPAVGNLVEITHEDGLKTIYYSLTDVAVRTGDRVTQGDLIGKAGRNELGKDFGVHLHFEVHKDGEPVNPAMLLGDPADAGQTGETGLTDNAGRPDAAGDSADNAGKETDAAEQTMPQE
jgi:stage II sporulation protein Q